MTLPSSEQTRDTALLVAGNTDHLTNEELARQYQDHWHPVVQALAGRLLDAPSHERVEDLEANVQRQTIDVERLDDELDEMTGERDLLRVELQDASGTIDNLKSTIQHMKEN